MESGVAVSVIEVPYSDGPVSGGASWFFIVQPADARHAVSAAPMSARVEEEVRFIYTSPLKTAPFVWTLWVVTW